MKIDFARCQAGKEEKQALLRVFNSQWLASGKENELFEKEFADYIGTKYAVCVNSGSSANLLALAALGLRKITSRLPAVLASAAGFPATVSPILHLGYVPVLVDYDLRTHNIHTEQALARITPNGVDAIIFAHTMGIPVHMDKILKEAKRCDVPVIEDGCEAVGASYGPRKVGAWGTLGTFSFYPSHQMTAFGGGGMVVTNDQDLMCIIKSMRDWGKRWDWRDELGDWKTSFKTDVGGIAYYKGYTYETLGYNFKLPEGNAAYGREQLRKLDGWIQKRQENYEILMELFKDEEWIQKIEVPKPCEPSWFGFTMTLKDGGFYGRDRDSLAEYFEDHGIRTRPFFAGNLTRHKPFREYRGFFPNADYLMSNSLFVGLWQGLNREHFEYIRKVFLEWKASRSAS